MAPKKSAPSKKILTPEPEPEPEPEPIEIDPITEVRPEVQLSYFRGPDYVANHKRRRLIRLAPRCRKSSKKGQSSAKFTLSSWLLKP